MLHIDSISNLALSAEDLCQMDSHRVSSPDQLRKFADGLSIEEDFLLDARWQQSFVGATPRAPFDFVMLEMLPAVYQPAHLESLGGHFGIEITGIGGYTLMFVNERVVCFHDLPVDFETGEPVSNLEVAPDVFMAYARGLILNISEDILADDDEYEDRPVSDLELQLHGMPAGGFNYNGGASSEQINGSWQVDTLKGGSGADSINGYHGASGPNAGSGDSLLGENGNDIIMASAGYNNLYSGGNGLDTWQKIYSSAMWTEPVIDLSNGLTNATDNYGNVYRGIENFVGSHFGKDTLELGDARFVHKVGQEGVAILNNGDLVVWENFETINYTNSYVSSTFQGSGNIWGSSSNNLLEGGFGGATTYFAGGGHDIIEHTELGNGNSNFYGDGGTDFVEFSAPSGQAALSVVRVSGTNGCLN